MDKKNEPKTISDSVFKLPALKTASHVKPKKYRNPSQALDGETARTNKRKFSPWIRGKKIMKDTIKDLGPLINGRAEKIHSRAKERMLGPSKDKLSRNSSIGSVGSEFWSSFSFHGGMVVAGDDVAAVSFAKGATQFSVFQALLQIIQGYLVENSVWSEGENEQLIIHRNVDKAVLVVL